MCQEIVKSPYTVKEILSEVLLRCWKNETSLMVSNDYNLQDLKFFLEKSILFHDSIVYSCFVFNIFKEYGSSQNKSSFFLNLLIVVRLKIKYSQFFWQYQEMKTNWNFKRFTRKPLNVNISSRCIPLIHR